jgi:hypothetical protein
MSRRWLRRTAGLVLLEVVLLGGLRLLGVQADLVRFVLVVALVLTTIWLVLDTADQDASWEVEAPHETRSSASDTRLQTYTRVLEDHVAAREPTAALRDRLRWLVIERLELHHGLGIDDPEAQPLLGPGLSALLAGPPRRIDPAELNDALTRIEEL